MLTSCVEFSPFFRRSALKMWKQRHGDGATYRNLIGAFKRAGNELLADTVRKLASKCWSYDKCLRMKYYDRL